MIQRDRSLLAEGLPSPALLKGVLAEHLANVSRLNRLHDYYALHSPITARTRAEGLPNNRLTHAFARYIVSVSTGYLGQVSYSDEGQKDALTALKNAYRQANTDAVDVELAKQQSLYGRGVEVIYADERLAPKSAALDPRCAFVVYDGGVDAPPLFGVSVRPVLSASGRARGYQMTVYLKDRLLTYEAQSLSALGAGAPKSDTPHYFGRVPLIEYWNNEEETGDFESVMSLMDAYDVLESDRVNDQEQLVNALLVITGAQLLPDEKGRTPAQQLRQDKLLYLPDRDAGAEYLTRAGGGADAETLRASLAADIHKFSMIPDLSDENFSGNASGVAMRYKLLGLEQLTRVKERWFREALRERLRAYARFLSVKGGRELDPDAVRMTFERALPKDALETAQMVKTLEGIVPDNVLVSQLPFVDKT